MIHLTSIVRTSIACPSQWDGVADDGTEVYIRYRGGQLEIWAGPVGGGDPIDEGEMIYARYLGGDMDGTLSYGQLLEAALSKFPELLGWPAPGFVDDPFSAEDLHNLLRAAAEAMLRLEASGVAEVMTHQDSKKRDKVMVTNDRLLLKEALMRGEKAISYDSFQKDQK